MVQEYSLATYNDLINDYQWKFTGIGTPVVNQQIPEVLGEPFVWYEEPIVMEPRRPRVLRLNNGDVTERCSKKSSWNVYRRLYIKTGNFSLHIVYIDTDKRVTLP